MRARGRGDVPWLRHPCSCRYSPASDKSPVRKLCEARSNVHAYRVSIVDRYSELLSKIIATSTTSSPIKQPDMFAHPCIDDFLQIRTLRPHPVTRRRKVIIDNTTRLLPVRLRPNRIRDGRVREIWRQVRWVSIVR